MCTLVADSSPLFGMSVLVVVNHWAVGEVSRFPVKLTPHEGLGGEMWSERGHL